MDIDNSGKNEHLETDGFHEEINPHRKNVFEIPKFRINIYLLVGFFLVLISGIILKIKFPEEPKKIPEKFQAFEYKLNLPENGRYKLTFYLKERNKNPQEIRSFMINKSNKIYNIYATCPEDKSVLRSVGVIIITGKHSIEGKPLLQDIYKLISPDIKLKPIRINDSVLKAKEVFITSTSTNPQYGIYYEINTY